MKSLCLCETASQPPVSPGTTLRCAVLCAVQDSWGIFGISTLDKHISSCKCGDMNIWFPGFKIG